jgi:hypothetical protein
MGLDITYYTNATPCAPHEYDDDTCYPAGHVHVYSDAFHELHLWQAATKFSVLLLAL